MNCTYNQLTTLDLSECTALQSLTCDNNQLTTLNLSGCTTLQNMNCTYNQLTTLDLSECASLQELTCNNNQLTTLNLSGCTSLQELTCNNNQLTTLNLSGCTSLQRLFCLNNQLTTLDLRNTKIFQRNFGWIIVVICDDDVDILFASQKSSTKSENTMMSHYSYYKNNADAPYVVVATLPDFQVTQTGEHAFDVSLDKTLSTGNILVLLENSDSEDLQGAFIGDDGEEISIPLIESLDHVRVTANFEIGKKYAPVVAIKSDAQEANSGGCNIGALGAFIIMMSLGFMLRTRYIHMGR